MRCYFMCVKGVLWVLESGKGVSDESDTVSPHVHASPF